MGKSGTHLAFHVRGRGGAADTRRAVWFGGAELLDPILEEGNGRFCLAYRPSVNRFRGSEEIEMMVEDGKPGTEAIDP